MPMNYNVDDGNKEPEFFKPTDGKYPFRIDSVSERKFKASKKNPRGSSGYCFELHVQAGGPKDSRCFENVITSGSATTTWKMRQICKSVGMAFGDGIEMWDFENKTGVAEFKAVESGRYTNLEVDSYIDSEETAPPGFGETYTADADDPPF